MLVPNRHEASESYRYGFNGKEKDDELKGGEGNSYDFGERIYDSRIGRWVSPDKKESSFPWQSTYVAFDNNPNVFIDPDGMATEKPKKPFKIGKPAKPTFKYDDGFLGKSPGYTPVRRKPNAKDYAKYYWWGVKTTGATILRWDLGNALKGYIHFRSATGKDFNFDLPDYYNDDDSGKKMLKNAINIAKSNATEMLKKTGNIQITSEGFSAGGSDARFPYPQSEDWQKAIGAFNFWMSADVSAKEKNGIITYTMKLTIHAEDKYNFNPGMKDIKTGTPDSDNGRFEVTGLGKQFMQYGTSTHTVEWTAKSPTTYGKPLKL